MWWVSNFCLDILSDEVLALLTPNDQQLQCWFDQIDMQMHWTGGINYFVEYIWWVNPSSEKYFDIQLYFLERLT